jgi:outer membrane protein assembly factor BamD (BamD/ComL family)
MIFQLLSNKEIDKITEGVFNEDEDDFINTMERITECSNYDDATEILKSTFNTYKINPYSKDAVALTNAVANYFNHA